MSCPPQRSMGNVASTTQDLAVNSAVINKATVNQLTACKISTRSLVADDAKISVLNNAQLEILASDIAGREVDPAFFFLPAVVASSSINRGFVIGQFGTFSTRFVLGLPLLPGGQLTIGSIAPSLVPIVQSTRLLVSTAPTFFIIAMTIFPDGTVVLTDLTGGGAPAGTTLEVSDTHQVTNAF